MLKVKEKYQPMISESKTALVQKGTCIKIQLNCSTTLEQLPPT